MSQRYIYIYIFNYLFMIFDSMLLFEYNAYSLVVLKYFIMFLIFYLFIYKISP